MAVIPQLERTTVRAMYEAIARAAKSERRGHLGASQIGGPCARRLWYSFRFCGEGDFDGRMLRLFRRGQLEEAQFVADLRAAGVTVHDVDENGEQFRFLDVAGHVGGSMDGALLGVIEAPKTWHVAEFKTHNAKSFAALVKEGVQKSKPEHFSQVVLYMGWSGMQRAFYLAVNKDTDEVYSERIRFERPVFDALIEKARRIVYAAEPVTGVSEKPEFYICKMCPASGVCHEGRLPPVSCRTCAHATPEPDGEARWSCSLHGRDLTLAAQESGCADHVYIPALVAAEQVDASQEQNWVAYKARSGVEFKNGTASVDVFASSEVYAGQDGGFAVLGDVRVLRERMGATVHESHAA